VKPDDLFVSEPQDLPTRLLDGKAGARTGSRHADLREERLAVLGYRDFRVPVREDTEHFAEDPAAAP
jgi:hypothetical protein